MSHDGSNDNGSGGSTRRLATVSNVIIDVTEKFYESLIDFLKNSLAQYNVHISDIEPSRDRESCTPSTSFDSCTVIRTKIFVSFDPTISKCEMEYLVVDYLGSVANSLFDSYNVDDVWPKVGKSNSQFFITNRDRLPDADETSTFEGVLSDFLTDAFKEDQEQQFTSLCVDVTNTDFVDNDESQEVAVTARSAPIYPNNKRPHERPRDDKDELEYIVQERSSDMYGDNKDAAASTHTERTQTHDVLEESEREIMPKKTPERARGPDEESTNVEVVPPTEKVSPRSRDTSTTASEEGFIPPDVRRDRRPRRILSQQDSHRDLQEPKRTVKLDAVVTGRYRGPRIDDMDKKISDAVSGSEYRIEEALQQEDPDYYSFDDGGELQMSTVSPSVLDETIADDKGAEEEKNWKGMTGFIVLGCGILFFSLAIIHCGWRRRNDDEDISEADFSLQSIFLFPNCEENSSTTDSTTSSLSRPPTVSVPTTDSTTSSLSTPPTASAPTTTLVSILRKQERSILNKVRDSGTGTRSRVRWALDLDEKSGDSKSGTSSVTGSAPGAYSVKSNSSAGKLNEMWRKEGGDSVSSNDESVDDTASTDYTDEEEGIFASSSEEGSGSFAQFSVYGTALMCKQEDDMTITTDLYSTALLMEDDATVTTDNRSFLGQDYHGYIDEEEGR